MCLACEAKGCSRLANEAVAMTKKRYSSWLKATTGLGLDLNKNAKRYKPSMSTDGLAAYIVIRRRTHLTFPTIVSAPLTFSNHHHKLDNEAQHYLTPPSCSRLRDLLRERRAVG